MAPAAALLAARCAAPPGGDAGPAQTPPTYRALADTQAERLAGLQRVYARGTIELVWTDEDGRHFEQGDVDLWLVRPDRTALNVSKFGDRILWLGSDERRAWIFDLRGEETLLRCAGREEGWASGTGGVLPVAPGSLLALAGLTPFPDSAAAPVAHDAATDAWVVETPIAGGRLRSFVDRHTLLPVRVEQTAPDGTLRLTSRLKLDRYEPLRVTGRLHGRALFPTLVDIVGAVESGQVKIAVRDPTDDVEDRYFDLGWLVKALDPHRIEGECGGAVGAGRLLSHTERSD